MDKTVKGSPLEVIDLMPGYWHLLNEKAQKVSSIYNNSMDSAEYFAVPVTGYENIEKTAKKLIEVINYHAEKDQIVGFLRLLSYVHVQNINNVQNNDYAVFTFPIMTKEGKEEVKNTNYDFNCEESFLPKGLK